MAKLVDEARTIHPGGYGTVPREETMIWARQHLRIWSRQWQAVVHLAIIASTEWDQIARSRRVMLVWVGEENGWELFVGREWGTRGHSRCELTRLRALSSSALLLFPLRSLLSEKKANRECREERLISLQWWHSVPVRWVLFQHGWHPSMKHTRCVCQWHAGEPCTIDKNSVAFATTFGICFFGEMLLKESRQIAAGNPWTSCCRDCGLLRSGESAEQREVWFRCDCSFNSEGLEYRRAKIL